ncbi:hypothetical protein DSO57_1025828 [Entomophthora muscae]|uniref:Uncharacterized protein n=1 Tax=Entomophthora muscae TaxID=34485 RepID=A0ACC2UM81_9FUNG|nr:hypothetical protein DSO57_1025828 [Entomophthora muscae]
MQKLVDLYPNRQIYALELPCIIVGTFSKIPTMDEILGSIDEFFAECDLKRCSFIAHSYGTIVCTWLSYHRPQYISKLTLVDPVCFNLLQSRFLQKCIYQQPSCFAHGISLFLIFRDPLLASIFSRNFWWHQNNLFPEDIKVPTDVYLPDLDWIIDTPKVFKYLQNRLAAAPHPNVKVHMLNVAHSEYLFNAKGLAKICESV